MAHEGHENHEKYLKYMFLCPSFYSVSFTDYRLPFTFFPHFAFRISNFSSCIFFRSPVSGLRSSSFSVHFSLDFLIYLFYTSKHHYDNEELGTCLRKKQAVTPPWRSEQQLWPSENSHHLHNTNSRAAEALFCDLERSVFLFRLGLDHIEQ